MKENKIIIHAITRMYLGGAQRIVLDILKELKKNKENLLLITGKDAELSEEVKKNSINIYIIPELDRNINPIKDTISFIKLLFFFHKLKKKYKVIYVHTHSSKAGILIRLACGIMNIENVFHTAHGWSFYKGQNKILYNTYVLMEKIVVNYTKYIIAVSKYVRDIGIESGIGDNKKYKIIYNGIKNPIIYNNKNKIKERLGIEVNKKIVLQVSCLKKQKSPITFIKIAEKMKNRDDLYFILAGDGVLKDSLINYIKHNNLNNILLTGWYENIDELYNIANVCTLTSIFEGMPLAILEAISYNIPIIASNIEPHREILEKDLLCNQNNVNCYSDKIIQLIKSSLQFNYKYSRDYNTMINEYIKLYF